MTECINELYLPIKTLALHLTLVTSIPALLDIINFSKLSGYNVNWNKSKALPLTAFFFSSKYLFQARSFQSPLREFGV